MGIPVFLYDPPGRRAGLVAAVAVGLVLAGCAGPRWQPVETVAAVEHERPRGVDVESSPAEEPAGTQPQGVYHVVEAGQTLWRIAHTYGVALDELAVANGIDDPSRIDVGNRLFVPGVAAVLEVAPTSGARPVTEWIWPIDGGRIVSPYGSPRRTHRHKGLDIAGQAGQPVRAAEAGAIVYSGAGMRGYGKTVIIDHGRGMRSLYAHNSTLLVTVGDRVERGQSIARVGRTGNATREHCHFEVRDGDVAVDPLRYVSPEIGVGR